MMIKRFLNKFRNNYNINNFIINYYILHYIIALYHNNICAHAQKIKFKRNEWQSINTCISIKLHLILSW